MKISRPRIFRSPRDPKMIRLETNIQYASWWARPERLWFEVPAELEGQVSHSGDPWLTAMLPLAITLNEPVELEMPVSPVKRTNARCIMSIWAEWYPWLNPVEIRAGEAPSPERPGSDKTASFFSGGLDSFFTVFHDRKTSGGSLDELLFIHGADIPIDAARRLEQTQTRLDQVALILGLPLVSVGTNLRQTRFSETNYDLLSVGSLLAAAGLILEPRYEKVLIPSTWPEKDLHPLGSHPLTDGLLSNSGTTFEQYGHRLSRIEKTEFLSQYPLALEHMQVCWEGKEAGNCGVCLKCLRTRTALEIIGALPAAAAFGSEPLDFEMLRRQIFTRERLYFQQLHSFALERGRLDVAVALESAFRRTERVHQLMLFGLIPRMRKRFYMQPAGRRWLRPVYHGVRQAAVWLNRRLP